MTTIKELAQYIDKQGTIRLGGLTVAVVVMDVKLSYGKPRFLVTPTLGEGTVWVEAVKLFPTDTETAL